MNKIFDVFLARRIVLFWWIFKLNFLEKKASNEEILFCIFDLFFYEDISFFNMEHPVYMTKQTLEKRERDRFWNIIFREDWSNIVISRENKCNNCTKKKKKTVFQ